MIPGAAWSLPCVNILCIGFANFFHNPHHWSSCPHRNWRPSVTMVLIYYVQNECHTSFYEVCLYIFLHGSYTSCTHATAQYMFKSRALYGLYRGPLQTCDSFCWMWTMWTVWRMWTMWTWKAFFLEGVEMNWAWVQCHAVPTCRVFVSEAFLLASSATHWRSSDAGTAPPKAST